ncbi:conserved virulence factor C family protein [Cohnella nanjingensis]|uniref:Conserved virulence factor C family protein n=1 Tax=Cohnella nanjingensis TaxID=1387779 RepID=A0A7X0RQL0_9BACL|nr:conserved virulence factor C family protein [Cohnella nanjingensis]MBB6671750.1 conserved virulence factor C family protein [Cohnella nanjingensis]
MKLLSIEPTPSPNSMKLNVDEKLASHERYTYTLAQRDQVPPFYHRLLGIAGVKAVFRAADFIAVDRKPNADWAVILGAVRDLFGADSVADAAGASPDAYGFGEARVLVQMYRGIPMQIRVQSGGQEARAALPDKFAKAVSEAAGSSMIRERKLEEFGVRYGDPQDILEEVKRELNAAYPDDRLRSLIEQAQAMGAQAGEEAAPPEPPAQLTLEELAERLQAPDWETRYAALARLKPESTHLPLLAQAVRDTQVSVRRLAVVYLGDLRIPEALPPLFGALQDSSASVRRTAGDTLSDIGDPAAIGPMVKALGDGNKLVRWRAARFLYEAGDETALEALERVAATEQEFEVKLQAEMAVARIRSGEEAAGSVWQQMTRMREQQDGQGAK